LVCETFVFSRTNEVENVFFSHTAGGTRSRMETRSSESLFACLVQALPVSHRKCPSYFVVAVVLTIIGFNLIYVWYLVWDTVICNDSFIVNTRYFCLLKLRLACVCNISQQCVRNTNSCMLSWLYYHHMQVWNLVIIFTWHCHWLNQNYQFWKVKHISFESDMGFSSVIVLSMAMWFSKQSNARLDCSIFV
jgi:hypothetical protein